jgi:hypothetical protein
MEARLLVTLKGGEWSAPQAEQRGANAVAVRGLDMDRGLIANSNKTYDDTMYVILEGGETGTEVYEYRLTTESSDERRGVGRLDAKQVQYVRGLHKGKDPGYRLKTNAAEGSRQGLEGTFQIVGANIHSAYARQPIDSATPLKPNVSLGCQVVASGKRAFEQTLVFVLDKKGIQTFPYTIVNGEELAALDAALQQSRRRSVLVHLVSRPAAASNS